MLSRMWPVVTAVKIRIKSRCSTLTGAYGNNFAEHMGTDFFLFPRKMLVYWVGMAEIHQESPHLITSTMFTGGSRSAYKSKPPLSEVGWAVLWILDRPVNSN